MNISLRSVHKLIECLTATLQPTTTSSLVAWPQARGLSWAHKLLGCELVACSSARWPVHELISWPLGHELMFIDKLTANSWPAPNVALIDKLWKKFCFSMGNPKTVSLKTRSIALLLNFRANCAWISPVSRNLDRNIFHDH